MQNCDTEDCITLGPECIKVMKNQASMDARILLEVNPLVARKYGCDFECLNFKHILGSVAYCGWSQDIDYIVKS